MFIRECAAIQLISEVNDKEPFASFKLIPDVKKSYFTARVTAIYMLVAPVHQAISGTNFNVCFCKCEHIVVSIRQITDATFCNILIAAYGTKLM